MGFASETIAMWRRNPVAFVRQNFGVEPDEWQKDALMAFADPTLPRISMQACAGPGKSAVLAWMGWHFLSCQGEVGDHPKGFAVAVTADNLNANLWPEFSKWQQRSPYLMACFTWGSERIFQNENKSTWFLEARSFPKTASAEEQGKTLSGLHGGYVLALVDESGAIPPQVSRAAEQALATKPHFGKVCQAGNPLTRAGMLYEAANNGRWHVIRITGDPDDPKRSPRVDIEWAREAIKQHGRNDPWVMAYILGQFPLTAFNALLGPDDVRDAMARHPKGMHWESAARILGVDVAREGDDLSVIFRRQGICASWAPRTMRSANSLHGAGVVSQAWDEAKADGVFIDNTGGFGGGWIDQLKALGRNPAPVHFSEEATDPRFANKRSEMWHLMAEWIKGGGSLPNVPELVAELTVPTYTFKGDRLIMEDKKQIKARLHRSPDYADALALTFAFPVVRRDIDPRFSRKAIRAMAETMGEYNPIADF